MVTSLEIYMKKFVFDFIMTGSGYHSNEWI